MQREQVASIFEQLQRQDEGTSAGPRLLFVYAHPDDEVIAVGAHLPLLHHALFLQVTDGAPADNTDGDRLGLSRDEYRSTRALEVRAAFAAAGLPEARHRTLNHPDKEAAFHLSALIGSIGRVLEEERPVAVFTHPYEGGHADHDACAFAVHTAVRQLGEAAPLVIESPFYFADVNGGMHAGSFLQEDHAATFVHTLSPEQQQTKRDALAAFATQQAVLASFPQTLLQERFRIAPEYDFREPAVEGVTFYESFIPNLNAARFSHLASQALDGLGTAHPHPSSSGIVPPSQARVTFGADPALAAVSDLPGLSGRRRVSLP